MPKHLRRLLRKMGIMAIYRKPNLSRRNREHSVYPYLLRGLTITDQIKFGVLIVYTHTKRLRIFGSDHGL